MGVRMCAVVSADVEGAEWQNLLVSVQSGGPAPGHQQLALQAQSWAEYWTYHAMTTAVLNVYS